MNTATFIPSGVPPRKSQEPEIQEASESYMPELQRLEARFAPPADKLVDEANASYIQELNHNMHTNSHYRDADRFWRSGAFNAPNAKY